MSDYPLVLIEWHDAVAQGHGWRPIQKIGQLEPEFIRSIGWVVKEDDKGITLVSSITRDGDADGDVLIPLGCIISRTSLQPKL